MTTAELPVPASARIPERPSGARPARRRTRRWQRRYVGAVLLGDVVAAVSAALLAGPSVTAPVTGDPRLALLVAPVWLLAVALHRGYDTRWLFIGAEEYRRVVRAGFTFAAVVALAAYAMPPEVTDWPLLVTSPALVGVGLLTRQLHRRALRRAWAAGRCRRRVVAVGHPGQLRRLRRQLRDPRRHGIEVVAACLPTVRAPGDGAGTIPVPVEGTFEQVPESARRADADAVLVLPSPQWEGPALRRLSWRLASHDIDLIVASPLLDVGTDRLTLCPVGDRTLLHVAHPRYRGPRHLVKEVFDRIGAALLLVLLAPVMLAVAALIRVTPGGRGPILFRQVRVGRGGVEFPMYKFRTMHPGAEARLAELRHLNHHDGVLFKLRDDPRVTPVGRWLRRCSLDELPQLFNVVRGEMSLVGPRPPLPREVARVPGGHASPTAGQAGHHRPVAGRGPRDLSWEEAVRLDLRYVENWSLALDLAILLRTAAAVARPSGAY